MAHFCTHNVNSGFRDVMRAIDNGFLPTSIERTRAGTVVRIDEPLMISYSHPHQRVLFNEARDCNPFFHLYEALWMLAGQHEVKSLAYFNSRMNDFSDDTFTLHGAYGHRWKRAFNMDQLKALETILGKDPNTRRAVLQMWSADSDLHRVLYFPEVKDVPCNTHAYLSVNQEDKQLDLLVSNRSNDLLWGLFGANYVHFTMLQEYMALRLGLIPGVFHQVTFNAHLYRDRCHIGKWLADDTPDYYESESTMTLPIAPTLAQATMLDVDIAKFVSWVQTSIDCKQCVEPQDRWENSWLWGVPYPMLKAFMLHKERRYDLALACLIHVEDHAWRRVAERWIEKRRSLYESDDPTHPQG